jgi:antirestriction protein
MTAATTTPEVWIACLASYNAGRLIGEWVDATDIDNLTEAVERIKHAAVVAARGAGEGVMYFPVPEEFAIHDYNNFPDTLVSQLGEYPDWKTIVSIAKMIEDHGDKFVAYINACEIDLSEADSIEGKFEEASKGEWESEKAYAEEYLEDMGILGESRKHPGGHDFHPAIPEEWQQYFDLKSWSDDNLFRHGSYTFVQVNGQGYVFDTNV